MLESILFFLFRAVLAGMLTGVLSYVFKPGLLKFYPQKPGRTAVIWITTAVLLTGVPAAALFVPRLTFIFGCSGIRAGVLSAVIIFPGLLCVVFSAVVLSSGGFTQGIENAEKSAAPAASAVIGYLAGLILTTWPDILCSMVPEKELVVALLFGTGFISSAVSGFFGSIIDVFLMLTFSPEGEDFFR